MQKENLVSEDEVFEDILSESEKSESENALNISSNLAEDKDKIEDIKDTETSRLPLNQKIKNFFETYLIAYKSLKTSKISLIWAFISLSIIFFTLAFISFNQRFLISVPTYGGNINEGVIGTARFINPVLAYSQVDKDLIALIYSGLTKKDINGNLILNLADSIEMSPDGLHYNVKIKENAKFQDETNLTSDDVIYTINMIQDQNINSPLAINFEGVSVTKVNDKELIFNLKKPYIYFKDNLSFGILPKHVWQNLTDEEFSLSDYNLNPIGSGPYKISSTVKNSGITQEFHLVSFKNYALGRPFIDDINIFIYPNQKSQADSLNAGTVSRINTLSKEEASSTLENKNVYLATSSLPNLYSLSLNPNKNILLSDKNIRLALAAAIDKNLIVNNIFNSTTEIADSNLPFYRTSSSSEESVNNIYPDLSLAKTYLAKYTQSKATKVVKKTSSTTTISTSTNPVSMTSVAIKNTDISINKSLGIINISTVDTNELKSVANIIKENWEALGFTVNIKVYELSDLSGNVIKNRDFDVLLFGSIVKKDTDLFAYWSSTQRNYPGLNITGYVSKNLDKDLDVLRNSQDLDQRQISLDDINTELNDEMPSIPLYTKLFTYYINDDYQDTTLIPKYMSSNEDRFANIESWYIYKEEIWSKAYFKNIIEKLENIIHEKIKLIKKYMNTQNNTNRNTNNSSHAGHGHLHSNTRPSTGPRGTIGHTPRGPSSAPASRPYTPRPAAPAREPRETYSRSSLASMSKKPSRMPMRPRKSNGPKFETKISDATELAHIPALASDSIRIINLGGVEEIGRNMSCIEMGDSIVVVDCGFQFSESTTPGIECILPNTRYLEENKHKIKGMLITHGHLDHIGAIPYILPRIGNPTIYARNFTGLMIRKRHEEFPHLDPVNLHTVEADDTLTLGDFKIRFFAVSHAIPDSMGIIIETPYGDIVHTGDLRLDHNGGVPTEAEIERYKIFENRNILCLLTDSTNCENPGFSISDRIVFESINQIIKNATGRLMISTFSSQVERMLAIMQMIESYGKKIVVEGRSIKTNIEVAKIAGLLKVDPNIIVPIEDLERYPEDKVVVLATGAQGEEFAALNRMANGTHKYLKLNKRTTILMSSSIVPGNERAVQMLKDKLSRKGAHIIHYKTSDVHSSGHANHDELMWIHQKIHPKFFIPVHGYHYMLRVHADIQIKDLGMPEENVIIPDNGMIIEIQNGGKKIVTLKELAPNEMIIVDGMSVGKIQDVVMRDRQMLAEDGMFVIIGVIDSHTRHLKKSPDLISRGFVYLKESQDLLWETRSLAKKIIEDAINKNPNAEMETIKEDLNESISKFLLSKTAKRPVIIPVIIVV